MLQSVSRGHSVWWLLDVQMVGDLTVRLKHNRYYASHQVWEHLRSIYIYIEYIWMQHNVTFVLSLSLLTVSQSQFSVSGRCWLWLVFWHSGSYRGNMWMSMGLQRHFLWGQHFISNVTLILSNTESNNLYKAVCFVVYLVIFFCLYIYVCVWGIVCSYVVCFCVF